MKDVTLNQREQARLQVLNSVMEYQLPRAQAAEILGISERQVRRILAAYRRDGAAALVHGNRGRKPRNSVPEDVAATTVILASEKYSGFNHSHLTEVLAEREGIQLSRQTISRLLHRHGLTSARAPSPPPSIVYAGSVCPRRACCCRSTAATTLGRRTEGPDSYCCWQWTTPPARWPMPYSDPRRTLGATSCSWMG